MRNIKKIFIWFVGIIILLVLSVFIVGCYLYYSSDYLPPDLKINKNSYKIYQYSDSIRYCGDNMLLRNKYGLWEVKISGSPLQRGAAYGAMCKDLMEYQEDVFVDQINKIVSSKKKLEFLHKLVAIFNRNMASHIPQEYREEIFAISSFCSDKYNNYGNPYERQLNYHAAHDIGHSLQEYMLVGCSSFATWDDMSVDRKLVVARNFDFYVGDDFAKNKMVLFVEPEKGYKFASVSWPGMMGVVSGMNEKGLTVTINAAKGPIPISSATPISIVVRRILQYSSNIEEAYKIASVYKTFVSESILVGSAKDGRAVVIEKSPEKISMYETDKTNIVCTNHYQSKEFKDDDYNIENIKNSDSRYRLLRLNELIEARSPIDVNDAVDILRNRYGISGADIGLTNEKSINQFIGHHSVVFLPQELKMWVSTSPWQIGPFVCYDLHEVFSDKSRREKSYAVEDLSLPYDSISMTRDYDRVVRYRCQVHRIKDAINRCETLPKGYIEDFISNNGNFFQTYNTVGDYLISLGDKDEAVKMWKYALSKEIPRKSEVISIEKKIKKYDSK